MRGRNLFRENRGLLTAAALLGLLPLLLCMIYCALEGKWIGEVFLPGSYWNDELFYYKQVEGILRGGAPGGYFGFNESRGRYLSFAAWSPVLLIPWCLWGMAFGWKLLSPVLCNLVLAMVSLACFVLLARPGKRQLAVTALLLALFKPFPRFILSCMPEVFCWSLVILLAGMAFAYFREKEEKYLWWMTGLAAVLTVMRPYFLVLFLLPLRYLARGGVRKAVGAAAAAAGSFGIYGLLKYCFSAAYLSSLFDISFLTIFIKEGFGAGMSNLAKLTLDGVHTLVRQFLREAVQYGNFPGSLYAVFGLTGALFVAAVLAERLIKGGGGRDYALGLWMIVMLTAMMGAVLYMYKVNEGGRHLGTFIILGILVLGMSLSPGRTLYQGILACALLFFFLIKPGTDYDYQLPADRAGRGRELAALGEQLAETMRPEDGISWENTVIWLAYDMVDGEIVPEEWQQLYALPAGFGINHCSQPYVLENFAELNSRYIAVIPGGEVERRLKESGARCMGANEKLAVYDRRREENEAARDG